MSRFPSDAQISSRAGLCPGDNESAKKRKSGKTRAYAAAHSMLIAIYHILKDGIIFKDLGTDYNNQFHAILLGMNDKMGNCHI